MAKSASVKLASCLSEFLAVVGDQVRYAMIGGLAVSARTAPRFTADIDFAVAVPDDAAAEAIIYRLSNAGFVPEMVMERTDQKRMATVRLRQSPRSPMLDMLFSATGIESEIVEEAERLTVLACEVPVARVGHLIAMKLVARDDTRRPMDRVDLLALSKVADAAEWARAEEAVRLIKERGFARGRDLQAALAEWRAQR